MRLPGDRAGEQGLAGTGRPGHQHAARPARPGPVIAAGIAQVVHDLADLRLHRGVAGHVSEPGDRPFGGDDPRFGLGHAGQAANTAAEAAGLPADAAGDEIEQAADEQQWQQPDQHRQQRGGRGGGGGGDLDVMGSQVTGQAIPPERDRDGDGERLPAGQGAAHLARRADGHRADRPGADIGHEPGVAQLRARGRAARQDQQHQKEGCDGRGKQPPPPPGRVRRVGGAVLGHAHLRAPSRCPAARRAGSNRGLPVGLAARRMVIRDGCTPVRAAGPAGASPLLRAVPAGLMPSPGGVSFTFHLLTRIGDLAGSARWSRRVRRASHRPRAAGMPWHQPRLPRGCPLGGSCMTGTLPERGFLLIRIVGFLGSSRPARRESDHVGRQRGPGSGLPREARSPRHPGAASGQSCRHGLAPGPPCGLGLSNRGGGRALGEGPDFSEMARQLAVADSSPRTANSPRLMRCRIT